MELFSLIIHFQNYYINLFSKLEKDLQNLIRNEKLEFYNYYSDQYFFR